MLSLFDHIELLKGFKIFESKRLHGGDINKIYDLKTSVGNRIIKINQGKNAPDMFEKESKGLNLLRETKSFKIPEVIDYGEIGNSGYLILEKIEIGKKPIDFWETFAEDLAKLHQNSNPRFGLNHDNYIGSLPQYNQNTATNSAKFFINNRLEPQFQLADKNGFSFKEKEKLFKYIETNFPNEKPALIHGDLWNGNYLVDTTGIPVLIDPAVAYASREMDLAMMKLFGGFPRQFFEMYNEFFPLEKGWEERIEIWQLYYLLVHLNLFGSGYLPQVKQIIDKY